VLTVSELSAQVTTGSIRGTVTDAESRPLEGARVTAVHTPSGTQYIGVSRADGRFNIPGMRVGGPYTVAATMIGYARQSRDDIEVSLGVASDIVFTLSAVATQLSAVTVTSEGGEMSSTRTGAATAVRREQLEQLPTISRRLTDFTRLTPQSSGTSFAGADSRLNHITVDGAAFNNSFGLGGQPGDRTGVAPISLDAIEAVQVSIAPFDVRQAGFVGAAVNTVTKSGTNTLTGALYYNVRDQEYVGRRAARIKFDPGTFAFDQIGFRVGGPVLRDKLFFFLSYESDENEQPGNTFLPRDASESEGGNITRVLRTDLQTLSNYLSTNFGLTPGAFEDYPGLTPSKRLTTRLDYAMSDRNKFSLRYTKLESETDNLISTSSSLTGIGRARNASISFTGSNYTILENIDSWAAEWNSLLTDRLSNQMTVTFTEQDESRGQIANLFPFVDILAGDISATDATSYTSFGSEPFTPNNELRYSTFQIQNNLTWYGNRHDLTVGFAIERYESQNVFNPGTQSAYTYNSLTDFYADAANFVGACGTNPANWGSCTAPTTSNPGEGPRHFQVRYNNIPGMTKPVQPLEVSFSGVYLQDEWRLLSNLTVTGGLRMDIVSFGQTGFENTAANALDFRDEDGNTVRYKTQSLPESAPLFSPRFGFNYDARRNGQTIVRGGSGIFTGRPLYVWISNQIGNNGVLTGFIDERVGTGLSLDDRPFHPDPDHYKPAATGGPAAQYQLALTDNDFKFPQVWRSNLAVDHRFQSGWRGSLEFIWGRDVNGIYYINANQPVADAAFAGVDPRMRWASDKCATVVTPGPAPDLFTGNQTNRLHCSVQDAIVLKNQNVGRAYNASISIERAFRDGLFIKAATAYGTATNTVDPGSIAGGSFFSNPHTNDPNNPSAALSGGYQGRRSFLVVSHTRDWFGWGNTTLSGFLENATLGNRSYTFSNDMNGDGGTNDLIYIPRDIGEMNFSAVTVGGVTYSVAQQEAAWQAYIEQDKYLRTRRGQYAERGRLILPTITRLDVSVSQDLSRMISGQRNSLQVRFDILNFTNMLNSDWGVASLPVSTTPLASVAPATTGTKAGWARYTMRVVGSGANAKLMDRTFQKAAGTLDVWRMQLGLRYTFN
jgi:hypothetical protein